MPAPRSAAPPIVFLFLMLPYGINLGVVTVTLPFVTTHAGISVAASAAIVGIGILPNTWRFLWSPVADLTLTLHRWTAIGMAISATTLVLFGLVPVRPDTVALVTAWALIAQLGAIMASVPVAGLLAYAVPAERKGRASGWYQVGLLGGSSLGGGAGIWLTTHVGTAVGMPILAAVVLACIGALWFVPAPAPVDERERLGARFREIGRDILDTVRSPRAPLVLALISTPIGVGAAANLWAAIGADWNASPNTVAFATGVVSGLASAAGCVLWGWFADRAGGWWAYFGSGAAVALVAIVMAAAVRTPTAFTAGILFYSFALGMANAAFSALLFQTIGRGRAATTKYAIFSSLGNVPPSYMTAFDGWAHDRWGAGGMLNAEAALGLLLIAVGLLALWLVNTSAARRAPAVAA
jgi:MFS family permease